MVVLGGQVVSFERGTPVEGARVFSAEGGSVPRPADLETLMTYKLSPRNFTTQDDLYKSN